MIKFTLDKTVRVIFLTMISLNVLGQDKIITKKNEELNVRIVNQTTNTINYISVKNDSGQIMTLKKNRIYKIEFNNGFIDMLGNQNPRKNRPLGFSMGYEFSKEETYMHRLTTYTEREIQHITSTIDYFIIPQLNLELTVFNLGTSGFTTGMKIHINSNKSKVGITPFTGILFGSLPYEKLVLLPVGINYLGKSGLNLSMGCNWLFYNSKETIALEMRIGWKFKI